MLDLTVIFHKQPPIHIELYNTTAATQWKQLFTENYQRQFPLFRDMQKCSWENLEQLIEQANQLCGWNFQSSIQSIQDTTALHKHLEITLARGFEHVPAAWDNVLHELHLALHKIEMGGLSRTPHRGTYLQLEWFNNDFVSLPEDFEFAHTVEFGSIAMQNAYVGHSPRMIYDQNDHVDVFQTCRFHDRIKPGVRIITVQSNPRPLNQEHYRTWWHRHAPEFVAHHGWDQIMYYTGYPLIGQVLNVDDLAQLIQCTEVLELQQVIIN
jgi:hypothetical protein